jgi:hypothetical protein
MSSKSWYVTEKFVGTADLAEGLSVHSGPHGSRLEAEQNLPDGAEEDEDYEYNVEYLTDEEIDLWYY